MKLNVKAFGLACGLLWGIGVFFLTWWLIALEGIDAPPTIINRVYPGYEITPIGAVVGMVWGFIDAGIGGAVFAWLYNLLALKFLNKCS
ncbi:MAG TPA: bacteriophage holin [Anaerohalosphaeraceae bacterium]|nr:bacteriophage holin [Phycisphaerae bacterium]HOK95601.1 bacteriophage holin [Anaerohalosphaeraceae bacterium]HOL30926.1 bacteriophage holin [Anaerohalosphaeraceae bacterium]HOM76279.1 bacteriophage holin [Anaerohalosphaeraceae bacterium]HPC65131.1 bacteriophage holin [Anaerohalosphaeraceae bacterium]